MLVTKSTYVAPVLKPKWGLCKRQQVLHCATLWESSRCDMHSPNSFLLHATMTPLRRKRYEPELKLGLMCDNAGDQSMRSPPAGPHV